MQLKMKFVILSIILLNVIHVCYSENKTFSATKDWQEIQEGQTIPAGLHVRINLQTGKKEAKLLDETEDNKKALSNNSSEIPAVKISKTLEEPLKVIPKDMLQLDYSPEKLAGIMKTYISYEEIKKNYENMKNFKSDSELITTLLDEYRNASKESLKTEDLLIILENFNYLVHQIDNALWFIDSGGLDLVILPMIVNQTEVSLRTKSLRILGALTQNNPNAQIKVFEKNFGGHLGQILMFSTHTEELSSAMYAFSSLLRKYPHAQRDILSKAGTKALISVLSKETELKIKAKAMTLISDLIAEKEDVHLEAESQEKQMQYSEITLDVWLNENDFCEIVENLIATSKADLLQEHDVTDYFVQALHITQTVCFTKWSQSATLRHILLIIQNRYRNSGDEYLTEISQAVETLIKVLSTTARSKDEL